MSLVISFFDVANPVGKCNENGVYILYGEASQLEYARLACNSIVYGASVVAVAHGLDVAKEGGKAVIVFATEEKRKEGIFIPGKTLDECCPDTNEAGLTNVNVINIRGKDYLRDDKNYVESDKVGKVPGPGAKKGWYDMNGRYCGDGEEPGNPEDYVEGVGQDADPNRITHGIYKVRIETDDEYVTFSYLKDAL